MLTSRQEGVGGEESPRRLTGTEARLIELVGGLVGCGSWEETRRYVEGHPELLTAGTITAIERAWPADAGEKPARAAVRQRVALLRRCQQVGLDAGFAEWTDQEPLEPGPGEIMPAWIALFETATREEAFRVLAENPQLLSDRAVVVGEFVASQAQAAGGQIALRVSTFRFLVERCRTEGVDAAIAYFPAPGPAPQEDDLQPSPGLFRECLIEFLTGDPERAAQLLVRHPELSTPECAALVAAVLPDGLAGGISENNREAVIVRAADVGAARAAVELLVEEAGETPAALAESIAAAERAAGGDPASALPYWTNVLNDPRWPRLPLGTRRRSLASAAITALYAAERTSDPAPLRLGRGAAEAALDLERPYASPRRTIATVLLLILWQTYDRYGDAPALLRAGRLADELAGAAGFDPGLAGYVGLVLNTRYQYAGDPDDLDRAVALLSSAYEAVRAAGGSPSGDQLSNLSLALREKYRREGDAEVLARAVRLNREALTAATTEDEAGYYKNNLALCLREQFQLQGGPKLLDEAIGLLREATRDTEAARARPRLYAIRFDNLGACHTARFESLGNTTDLNQALRALNRALELLEPDSPHRHSPLNNLGNAYSTKYYRDHRLADLDAAIGHYTESLTYVQPDTAAMATYLNNLGAKHLARHHQSAAPRDLDQAVTDLERAVAMTPAGTREASLHTNNLGGALLARGDLREAIELFTRALASVPPTSPHRPGWLNNLGFALLLAAGPDDSEQVDRSIEHLREAVAATAERSSDVVGYRGNLGNALIERYRRNHAQADLEAATTELRAASLGHDLDPSAALSSAAGWGEWAMQRKAWREATEAFGAAQVSARRLIAVQVQRTDQESWARRVLGLASSSATAFLKTGDARGAVLSLEQGRTLLIDDALNGVGATLRRLRREDRAGTADRYDVAARRLEGSQTPDAAREAAEALDSLASEIRAIKGYETFLLPTRIEEVHEAAELHPLVYLIAGEDGGHAVLVRPDGEISHQELPELRAARVQEQVVTFLRAIPGAGGGQRSGPVDDVLHWLWKEVMERVLATLDSDGHITHVTLVPTGLLSLLPLHAAGTVDRSAPTGWSYALDRIRISYAPSARMLLRARGGSAPPDLPRLLLVEEPKPVQAPALPYTEVEAAGVLRAWKGEREHLRHEKAGLQRVLRKIEHFDTLHFACHGEVVPADPSRNALTLADDEKLTVADVVDRDLSHVRHVVLSACQTSVIGPGLPDEVISLSTAWLQSGAVGVVGSFWAVNDESTAMLISRMYEEWQRDDPELELGEALRRAQIWLRDRAFPLTGDGAGGGRAPEIRLHEAPYHWAAFAYHGG
ncbi:CHAT domain-containing protein [Streptomyces sp. NPDC097981]|uniref:CHAT domain-containing protein n=1 Tax=Streptomyces sp. NPDC097981 TaxID=3155428 RepID=UPI003322016C